MTDTRKGLNKKAELIAALRREKSSNPCNSEKVTCKRCPLLVKGLYNGCWPIVLPRKDRKVLADSISTITEGHHFSSINPMRRMIAIELNKIT